MKKIDRPEKPRAPKLTVTRAGDSLRDNRCTRWLLCFLSFQCLFYRWFFVVSIARVKAVGVFDRIVEMI